MKSAFHIGFDLDSRVVLSELDPIATDLVELNTYIQMQSFGRHLISQVRHLPFPVSHSQFVALLVFTRLANKSSRLFARFKVSNSPFIPLSPPAMSWNTLKSRANKHVESPVSIDNLGNPLQREQATMPFGSASFLYSCLTNRFQRQCSSKEYLVLDPSVYFNLFVRGSFSENFFSFYRAKFFYFFGNDFIKKIKIIDDNGIIIKCNI